MRKIAVVAAGGTGGHLFPAQALAEALIARGWRIVLATDERTAIDALMRALRAVLDAGEGAASVEAATAALAKGTEAFAAQRMNRGIRQALSGKNVSAL